MNPTQTQGINIEGLSVAELNALLNEKVSNLALINAQIISAPVISKQQLEQRIKGLSGSANQTQQGIDQLKTAIAAISVTSA